MSRPNASTTQFDPYVFQIEKEISKLFVRARHIANTHEDSNLRQFCRVFKAAWRRYESRKKDKSTTSQSVLGETARLLQDTINWSRTNAQEHNDPALELACGMMQKALDIYKHSGRAPARST
ncbi:MAG TPA: hypothetical protein VHF05_03305 [Candidatus Paceibacterota bacterium]|nr:hypothetical protein [Candidatus Paceibacterota bacterium]